MLSTRRDELLGIASSVSGTDAQRLGPFFDQIVAALRKEAGIIEDGVDLKAPSERYGRDRSRDRAPVGDVVHEFGSLCTAIMTMVRKEKANISPREYQTLNESLDEGIAQAVTEFTASQETDRQQDATQQLGVVTHELRNALHAASISFRAIRDGQVPAGGRTAEVVDRSHRRLRSLIARFIATVRMRTGMPIRRQAIPIRGILQECIDMVALDAQDRDLRIASEIAQPATVEGDADMLFSAFSNLLQNAVKYSLPGGQLTVRSAQQKGRVCIEVEDSCGGLAPGVEASMFAPFTQMGTDRSGLGLGLMLARQIADAHGGSISVRNLPGKGCVLRVELPLRPDQRLAPESAP